MSSAHGILRVATEGAPSFTSDLLHGIGRRDTRQWLTDLLPKSTLPEAHYTGDSASEVSRSNRLHGTWPFDAKYGDTYSFTDGRSFTPTFMRLHDDFF